MRLFHSFYNRLKSTYCEYKDYRTSHHIVVFESDDWGSIRMPSKKYWDELLRMGFSVDRRPYERYDTLESAEDLEALFDVLCKHKDCEGNHPIITANMLMANPNFEKIKKSGFQTYFNEPVADTYTRYYGDTKVLDLMRQGMSYGVFMPQCHGREHFNVAQWMRGLRAGDEDLLTAFRYGMCGIAPKDHPEKGNKMMNALRAHDINDQEQINSFVAEGLRMFENMWGFVSQTFVAPCYCWSSNTEAILVNNGVKMIQTSRSNKPAFNDTKHFFYTGQLSPTGLMYSVRNCTFEPSTNEKDRSIDALMKRVESLFAKHKIPVISTHRINYVSGLSITNRYDSLTLLDHFLTKLLKLFPDVVFLSSDKLYSVFQ